MEESVIQKFELSFERMVMPVVEKREEDKFQATMVSRPESLPTL